MSRPREARSDAIRIESLFCRKADSVFRLVLLESLVRVEIWEVQFGRIRERRRASRVACSFVLVKMRVPCVGFEGVVASDLIALLRAEVSNEARSWSDDDVDVELWLPGPGGSGTFSETGYGAASKIRIRYSGLSLLSGIFTPISCNVAGSSILSPAS